MRQLTLYLKTTGEIVGSATGGPGASFETPQIGEIEGTFPGATHYVGPGEVEQEIDGETVIAAGMVAIERPAFALTLSSTTVVANGADTVEIGGFPEGCEVSVDGAAYTDCGGKPLQFGADVVGTYSLAFRCWPYQAASIAIEATAP